MAEAVFRAYARHAAPELPIDVDSAGTHDYHIGSAPDPRARRVAAGHGIDMSGLRARVLCLPDFERFEWIVAMDRQNMQAARRLAPSERRERVRLLLDYAPQQPLREVPDPYYGETADFELVLELTQQAAPGLLQFLRSELAKTY
jgi:protein-tyrosine phosphatase